MDAGFRVEDNVIESLNKDMKHPMKIRGMILGLDSEKCCVHLIETLPREHDYSDFTQENCPYLPAKDIR